MSLTQISTRMSSACRASKPAAFIAATRRSARTDRVRSGSPTRKSRPAVWRTTPGSGTSAAACTTHPKMCLGATAFSVEIPPRQAVDRGNDHGVGSDESLQPRQHRGYRMRLEADENRILDPEIGGLRRRAQRMDFRLASGNQGQSPSADRLEMSTAGDERHLV